MAFDQTYCMDALNAATRSDAEPSEFIYAFLDAYSFPKATITQVRNGGQRNVASRKDDGQVALKNWLYFKPIREGESVHEALQVLVDEDEPVRHKCRFLVVTDFGELTALDTKTDERLEVPFSDLATQYSRDGSTYRPREWFDVELDAAREIVTRIVDGTIVQYRVDNTTGRLVNK